MLVDYGPAARAFYARAELTVDLMYPLVYSLLLMVLLTMLFRHKPNRRFNTLPLLTLLFDYLENAAIITLLMSYPTQSTGVAIVCELAKLGKWLSFGGTIALIVYGLVLRITRRVPQTANVANDIQ